MVDTPTPSFDRPIPGMSLTAELGNRPWQQPPQYSTDEEALQWYIPRLTNPELLDQLLDVMETGIPLTTIADAMQTGGVMEGKHTIDVGMLIMPVLIEMMAYIGDDADIDYKMGTDIEKDPDRISNTKVALAMKKMKERLPEELNKEDEPVIDEPVDDMEAQPSGLMARRV